MIVVENMIGCGMSCERHSKPLSQPELSRSRSTLISPKAFKFVQIVLFIKCVQLVLHSGSCNDDFGVRMGQIGLEG